MFDQKSRYYSIPDKQLEVAGPDGTSRQILYKQRRLIPQPDTAATLAEHTVVQGDRLDNITARYLGDPTQFWRVADANLEPSPFDLADEPGTRITIPLPTH